MHRREFLKLSTVGTAALGTSPMIASGATPVRAESRRARHRSRRRLELSGERLDRVAFPMGGMGAGMICLEGTGALSHVSLRHQPQVFHEPVTFAAVAVRTGPSDAVVARVVEGPVPGWKLFGQPGTGNGAAGSAFGLPRFQKATFTSRFPFATVALDDPGVPVNVVLTGWSPFEPGDADAASLPVCGLEYAFTNPTSRALDVTFSWSAKNFMVVGNNAQGIRAATNGFTLWGAAAKDRSWEEGFFTASVLGAEATVNHAWFRGGWWDGLTIAWRDIASGRPVARPPVTDGGPPPGATLFVPFSLAAGETRAIRLLLCWHVASTSIRIGKDAAAGPAVEGSYRPWYTGRFATIDDVAAYWRENYDRLRTASLRFSDALHDTNLPPALLDAVTANLSILKSPTVLRQADGRLWAWEGCGDHSGCCHGSCTHVWNYAQAIPHLFPALERTLRETEFGPSQDARGHQTFRTALPIRTVEPDFHAAADGQLGGIMKVHREWRISGDTEWLRRLWPQVRRSLDYCIRTWDPERRGWLEEPHHNTYDIEFWGPDGMCTSFYLGALKAATAMGEALGDDVSGYASILRSGIDRMEQDLFDGEYFIQKIEWKNLKAANPTDMKSMVGNYSPEARDLLEREGPKYQYGTGCLSDGVLGCWLAQVCGVGDFVDAAKVASHLRAVHRHNLKADLSTHANPQRPAYACGAEGGLLLCSWPKGGQLSLPFVYSDEVWTGIEYQVASHLMMMGHPREGLEIVEKCRDRYDGRIRNPFNEYECGHWYARAMASYALLQGLSGARYDAVDQVLHLSPAVRGDFRAFLSTATGYGTVGVRRGKPFLEVVSGSIPVKEIRFAPA